MILLFFFLSNFLFLFISSFKSNKASFSFKWCVLKESNKRVAFLVYSFLLNFGFSFSLSWNIKPNCFKLCLNCSSFSKSEGAKESVFETSNPSFIFFSFCVCSSICSSIFFIFCSRTFVCSSNIFKYWICFFFLCSNFFLLSSIFPNIVLSSFFLFSGSYSFFKFFSSSLSKSSKFNFVIFFFDWLFEFLSSSKKSRAPIFTLNEDFFLFDSLSIFFSSSPSKIFFFSFSFFFLFNLFYFL